MLPVLAIAAVPVYPQEDWQLVWSTIVVGLVVVFIVLIVLIAVFWIAGKIMSSPRFVPHSKGGTKELPGAIVPTFSAPSFVDNTCDTTDAENEVVAAISAAVYSFNKGKNVVVTGIRRRESKSREGLRTRWGRASVSENLRRF